MRILSALSRGHSVSYRRPISSEVSPIPQKYGGIYTFLALYILLPKTYRHHQVAMVGVTRIAPKNRKENRPCEVPVLRLRQHTTGRTQNFE